MVLFDVTEEVLLRLPVKDLLRCKSVCKSWCSLISSPYFIKTHVKFNCEKDDKNNKQLGTRRIAMTGRYIKRFLNSCYIPPEWDSYHSLRIEGSSNGLVCMSSIFRNRICLTNPSTREFRKLQKPPTPPKDNSYPACYGFGYDSSTDDYKLVSLINQGSDGCFVQILSVKSNVWKLFGHVNYRFYISEPGILFNGALHWILFDINSDKVFIVSFDLTTEEFREIAQLDGIRYNRLGFIEDHLCIYQEHVDGRPYGIWVLKNYNVKQSSVVCWELLPSEREMKDGVHYMIKDCLLSRKMPSYFCCENIYLSTSGKHIWSPIFVQTLVSPYVNNHGRQRDTKKNQMIVNAGSCKEMREIEEAHTLKDGEKNGFHLDLDVLKSEMKKIKKRKNIMLMLACKRFKGIHRHLCHSYKRRGHDSRI